MTATRRSFIKGVGASAAVASVPALAQPASAHTAALGILPMAWPPPTSDLVFDQNDLDSTASLHDSGCRRNANGTTPYAQAWVPKCNVPGSGPTRLHFPGGNAALVVPVPGLLPRDEWTITFDVLNDSGTDFISAPFPAAQTFFIANAIMVWRNAANQVSVLNFLTFQGGTWTIGSGEWQAGTWKSFTVWWRRSDNTLEAMMDQDHAGRIVGGSPITSPPAVGSPPDGTHDGIQLGGTTGGSFPFEIANTKIHRWFWPYDSTPSQDGATLAIDAGTTTGPWHKDNAGVLALYEGFWETPEIQPYKDIRDEQLDLVLGEAGTPLIRFAGLLNCIGITETPPGSGSFTYDWTGLNEKLDALLNDYPDVRLHVSLDYTPAILQPPGGSQTSPPTNFAKWAQIASDVVGHCKDRYEDQFYSVTLWNEPDLGHYWTGTQQQVYSLWATTQTKLLADHPDMLMGSPEFAYIAGIEGFFNWLSGQSQTLKNSVNAIYHHNYLENLYSVRSSVARARAAATSAGVGQVPIRIPEYNLNLAQLTERFNDANSWFGTQPEHFTSMYAAAYTVAFLWECLEVDDVDMSTIGAIGTALLFWGLEAIVTSHTGQNPEPPVTPHPAFGTITLLSKLDGDRIEADSNWPSCKALATKDGDGVITVVYANFKPYRGFVDSTSFDLDWTGLPGSYTWTQWQLDEDHITNDRMEQIGTGTQNNLPASVTLGNLGIGAIQIVPS